MNKFPVTPIGTNEYFEVIKTNNDIRFTGYAYVYLYNILVAYKNGHMDNNDKICEIYINLSTKSTIADDLLPILTKCYQNIVGLSHEAIGDIPSAQYKLFKQKITNDFEICNIQYNYILEFKNVFVLYGTANYSEFNEISRNFVELYRKSTNVEIIARSILVNEYVTQLECNSFARLYRHILSIYTIGKMNNLEEFKHIYNYALKVSDDDMVKRFIPIMKECIDRAEIPDYEAKFDYVMPYSVYSKLMHFITKHPESEVSATISKNTLYGTVKYQQECVVFEKHLVSNPNIQDEYEKYKTNSHNLLIEYLRNPIVYNGVLYEIRDYIQHNGNHNIEPFVESAIHHLEGGDHSKMWDQIKKINIDNVILD